MLGLTQLIIQRWTEVITFVLVFGRVSGLVITAPFWGGRAIPLLVRVWVAVMLAACVYPGLPVASNRDGFTLFSLIMALAAEILFGVMLGWTAQILFAGMRLAGQEIENKLGLGLIQLADPQEAGHTGVFATFLELTAGLVFFSVNGHHLLVQALTSSYGVFPLAGDKFVPRLLEGLVTSAGQVFTIALRISAPVIVGLLLSDIILGVLSRAIPQMNVFMVTQPVQFGFGMLLLIVSLPALVWFCVRQLPALMVVPSGGG